MAATPSSSSSLPPPRSSSSDKIKLLVICGDTENWYDLCSGLDNVQIEQSSFDEMSICSYAGDNDIVIRLLPAKRPVDPQQKNQRTLHRPDLVVVRTFARGVSGVLGRKADWRNTLFGFQHSSIPMLNDFKSVYAELERPLMYGALNEIKNRVGFDKFPLIPQTYYPSLSEVVIAPPFPVVAKVSYPHAGFAKMKILNSEDLDDFAGVCALHNEYFTLEPLIEDVDYELRIVKIGNYYRAHKRIGSSWKVNTGGSMREDVEMNERWLFWVNEASKAMGGMSVLAIDAIVDKKGKEWILEVNGSEIGLTPEHEREALFALRDLAISHAKSLKSSLMAPTLTSTNEIKRDVEKVNLSNKVSELEEKEAYLQHSNDVLRGKFRSYRTNRTKWTILGAAIGCIIPFAALHLKNLLF